MRWTDCAAQDLKRYTGLTASVESIAERIAALEIAFTSIEAVNTARIPAAGGGRAYDDRTVDNMTERERLKLLLAANQMMIAVIDKGLAALDDTERLALDYFFIDRPKIT